MPRRPSICCAPAWPISPSLLSCSPSWAPRFAPPAICAARPTRSSGRGAPARTSPTSSTNLAVAYAGLGRADEARTLFRQLLDRNTSSATTWFNLGLFELQARRPDEAAAAFRRAIAIEPSYGEAWQALGAALLKTNPRETIDAWRRAEPLLPHDYDLLFNLGMLLADSDTPAAATPYLQRFLREAPRPRYARDVAGVEKALARVQTGRRP